MRPLIINLLTFLRTMNKNKNKNKKKTMKRVEKVDDVDDVVLEEKEYLLQPLRYLPQPLRRRGAQTTYKPDIPSQILLQTSPRIQTCKRLARPIFLQISPRRNPRIQAYKRLVRSTPLAVFPARVDVVQHLPGPQARAPLLRRGGIGFGGRDRVDIEEPRWVSPLLGSYWERFSSGCRLAIPATLPCNLNHSTHQS